jgi:hypothetical protein
MLLTHALIFITVIAALVSHFATIDDTASQLFAAFFAAGMAAAVRPLFGAVFSMHQLDGSNIVDAMCATYDPVDREIRMKRPGEIGLTGETYESLADIKYELRDVDALEDVMGGAGEVLDTPGWMGTSPGKDAALTTKEKYDVAQPALRSRSYVVRSISFTRAGYLLNLSISVGLVVAAFILMAPLCGRRLAVLERTIGIATLLDLLVVQPGFVGLVFLWRWMVSEEADGRAVHDLHPFDGELVPLDAWYADDAEADAGTKSSRKYVSTDVDILNESSSSFGSQHGAFYDMLSNLPPVHHDAEAAATRHEDTCARLAPVDRGGFWAEAEEDTDAFGAPWRGAAVGDVEDIGDLCVLLDGGVETTTTPRNADANVTEMSKPPAQEFWVAHAADHDGRFGHDAWGDALPAEAAEAADVNAMCGHIDTATATDDEPQALTSLPTERREDDFWGQCDGDEDGWEDAPAASTPVIDADNTEVCAPAAQRDDATHAPVVVPEQRARLDDVPTNTASWGIHIDPGAPVRGDRERGVDPATGDFWAARAEDTWGDSREDRFDSW